MANKRSLSGLTLPLFLAVSALGADPAAELLFVRRVQPLLAEKCLPCHGADPQKREGGLDLSTQAALLKGGDSGEPLLVAGKPAASPLLLAIGRNSADWSAMPPKEADRLSPEQVAWIREWVHGGAPWPNAERTREIQNQHAQAWSAEDGLPVKTSGGLSSDWTHRKYKAEALWAYQPVRKPKLDVQGSAAIDALLAARIPHRLESAPAADRRTLLRRLSFDLTGLPPTPEEIDRFIANTASDDVAFAHEVERLLASPHYGERMAQHWLDVVRYADSSGFANDYERGNAWRYRDYVVRSFNSDKPFDQFAREQIAGDEIDPDNPELLIAVGFLRMGPWELTGMEVAKVARQRFLDDVTNSVGETFLAHSLQCARCHDHKFDPVPTRDYYSIQAVFATTQLAERPAAFLPVENCGGFAEKNYLLQRQEDHREALKQLDFVLLANAEKWFIEHNKDIAAWRKAVQQAGAGEGVFNRARNWMSKQGAEETDYPPKLIGLTPDQFGLERVARKGLERLRWELERYEPFALSVYSGRTPSQKNVLAPQRIPENYLTAGELEASCILTGGDPFAQGEPVLPGVLSAAGGLPTIPLPSSITGRRKAFAEWLTQPSHPLTARVIANRVWMWHFGQPIAGNPNNFGGTGKRPTHPELLDWLAATLVEEGWSIKALHRAILSSQAYRRSAQHPAREQLARLDPLGTSYAAFLPRRLTGEELRDAQLVASGELNPALGGIPNRPEINLEAALQPRQVMGTFAAAWVPNPLPKERHRRSLYALKLRGLADPLLEVFNAPGPDFSCERRDVSTITPQVFALFNGQGSHSRSLALANRVLKELRSTTDKDFDVAAIQRCFVLILGRSPTAAEMDACLTHWREQEALQAKTNAKTPAPPLQIERQAVEENTGERFTFRERLPAYADFVPDLQAGDVNARTRSLADVCLVLFNLNEFAYVY